VIESAEESEMPGSSAVLLLLFLLLLLSSELRQSVRGEREKGRVTHARKGSHFRVWRRELVCADIHVDELVCSISFFSHLLNFICLRQLRGIFFAFMSLCFCHIYGLFPLYE